MTGFAGYAFCKAHSTAYGVEAYQSAWLKRYFPAEFMAGVLTHGKGFYHPLVYVLECHRLGLTLLLFAAWFHRDLTFSYSLRHPEQVQSYTLGNDDDSKSTLLGLFRDASRSEAPVHVIDSRAQADGLIVQALDSLQLLKSLAAQGIRFTFFLFPSGGHREHE